MRDLKAALSKPQSIIGGVLLISAGLMTAPAYAQSDIEISGEIAVLSGYVFRGITNSPENDGTAVQAGVEAATGAGLYAGWWASNLGYGTDDLSTTVENNFYAGVSGEIGGVGYDVGALYYWIMDDSDASGIEPYLGLSLGPVDLGVYYMAEDVSWSNQGDLFFTLGTGMELRDGFSVAAQASYGNYEDSGKYIASTGKSSTFRGVELTLEKAFDELPAQMFATYIAGGKDRDGVSQQDKIIVGLAVSF